MWTIAISLLTGVVVGFGVHASGLIHSNVAAIMPAVVAMLVTAVLLFRRVSGRIGPIVEEAQRHLQGGRRELALSTLRSGLVWGRWHPLLAPQLRTQIGALLYDQQDYEGALVELRQSARTPWESRAFLGACYFKTRDEGQMADAFEQAVKTGEKDDLAWTIYAWCLNAQGKKDEALKVLQRGLAKLPGNQRLQNNVEAIKEGKKLKVAPYGDRWARFGLDGSIPTGGQKIPKAMRGYAQRPGFRSKPIKKR